MSNTEEEEVPEHQDQRQAFESYGDELDQDVVCAVCRDGGWEHDNLIVFCEGPCGIAVHQQCYGVPVIPAGDTPWICDHCKALAENPSTDSICQLCGQGRGPLKHGGVLQAAHVQCVLGNPHLGFRDEEQYRNMYFQQGFDLKSLGKTECNICDKVTGQCIRCACEGCDGQFHVICALEKCLPVEFSPLPKALKAFCPVHENMGDELENWERKMRVGSDGRQESESRIFLGGRTKLGGKDRLTDRHRLWKMLDETCFSKDPDDPDLVRVLDELVPSLESIPPSLLVVPPRGRHYTNQWASEDLELSADFEMQGNYDRALPTDGQKCSKASPMGNGQSCTSIPSSQMQQNGSLQLPRKGKKRKRNFSDKYSFSMRLDCSGIASLPRAYYDEGERAFWLRFYKVLRPQEKISPSRAKKEFAGRIFMNGGDELFECLQLYDLHFQWPNTDFLFRETFKRKEGLHKINGAVQVKAEPEISENLKPVGRKHKAAVRRGRNIRSHRTETSSIHHAPKSSGLQPRMTSEVDDSTCGQDCSENGAEDPDSAISALYDLSLLPLRKKRSVSLAEAVEMMQSVAHAHILPPPVEDVNVHIQREPDAPPSEGSNAPDEQDEISVHLKYLAQAFTIQTSFNYRKRKTIVDNLDIAKANFPSNKPKQVSIDEVTHIEKLYSDLFGRCQRCGDISCHHLRGKREAWLRTQPVVPSLFGTHTEVPCDWVRTVTKHQASHPPSHQLTKLMGLISCAEVGSASLTQISSDRGKRPECQRNQIHPASISECEIPKRSNFVSSLSNSLPHKKYVEAMAFRETLSSVVNDSESCRGYVMAQHPQTSNQALSEHSKSYNPERDLARPFVAAGSRSQIVSQKEESPNVPEVPQHLLFERESQNNFVSSVTLSGTQNSIDVTITDPLEIMATARQQQQHDNERQQEYLQRRWRNHPRRNVKPNFCEQPSFFSLEQSVPPLQHALGLSQHTLPHSQGAYLQTLDHLGNEIFRPFEFGRSRSIFHKSEELNMQDGLHAPVPNPEYLLSTLLPSAYSGPHQMHPKFSSFLPLHSNSFNMPMQWMHCDATPHIESNWQHYKRRGAAAYNGHGQAKHPFFGTSLSATSPQSPFQPAPIFSPADSRNCFSDFDDCTPMPIQLSPTRQPTTIHQPANPHNLNRFHLPRQFEPPASESASRYEQQMRHQHQYRSQSVNSSKPFNFKSNYQSQPTAQSKPTYINHGEFDLALEQRENQMHSHDYSYARAYLPAFDHDHSLGHLDKHVHINANTFSTIRSSAMNHGRVNQMSRRQSDHCTDKSQVPPGSFENVGREESSTPDTQEPSRSCPTASTSSFSMNTSINSPSNNCSVLTNTDADADLQDAPLDLDTASTVRTCVAASAAKDICSNVFNDSNPTQPAPYRNPSPHLSEGEHKTAPEAAPSAPVVAVAGRVRSPPRTRKRTRALLPTREHVSSTTGTQSPPKSSPQPTKLEVRFAIRRDGAVVIVK